MSEKNLNYWDWFLSQSEANNTKNLKTIDEKVVKDYQNWYRNYSKEEIKLIQKSIWIKNQDWIIWKNTLEAIFIWQKSMNLKENWLIDKSFLPKLKAKYEEKISIINNSKTEKNELNNKINNRKLSLFLDQLNSIIDSQNNLIMQYREDTWIGMKFIDNVFWWQQVLKNYESMFESGKNEARKLKTKIENEFKNTNLTNSQKNYLNELFKFLNKIINIKFVWADLLSMTKASWNAKWETANLSIHWTKWVLKWTVEWVTAFFTSIFDLTVFTYKYLANWSEHRDKVNKQISEIWELVKNVDKKMLESAIKKATDHINSLPSEKQSEEIWKLSWLIIGFLIPMWAFWKWWKLLEKAKLKAISPTAKVSDKITEKALSLGIFTLNWPVESLIWIWLSKTLRWTINIVKWNFSIDVKVKEIDKTTKILEEEIWKTKNKTKKDEINKALDSLKWEKENLNKISNNISPENLKWKNNKSVDSSSDSKSINTEKDLNSKKENNLKNWINLKYEKIEANSPDDLFEKLKKSFNYDEINFAKNSSKDLEYIENFFNNPKKEITENLYNYLQKNPNFDIKKYIMNFDNYPVFSEQVIKLLEKNVKLDTIIEWKNTIWKWFSPPYVSQVKDNQWFIEAEILQYKLNKIHNKSYSYGEILGTEKLYDLTREKFSNKEILKKIEEIGKMESEFKKPELDFILKRIDKSSKEIINEFNTIQRTNNINNLLPKIPDNEKIFTKYFSNNQEKASEILHKIRSSENKKEDLEKFKILMREQQLEVDNIIQNSLKIMDNNTNISFEELLEKTLKNPEKFDINQKSEIITKLHEWYKKIQLIEKYLKEYKNNPNKLLELTLWEKIDSNIKMERIDTWLIFYITNEKDYFKFFWDDTLWKKFWISYIEELNWSISIVRWKKEGHGIETSIHEARHNLNDIIFIKNKAYEDIWSMIKDEIIAFTKDWTKDYNIKKHLNTYYKKRHTDYAKKIEARKPYWKKKKEDSFFDNKHNEIVESGMKNAIILQDIYWKETALNLMSITDIEKWHRLIPKDYIHSKNYAEIPWWNIAHWIAQIRWISNIEKNDSQK